MSPKRKTVLIVDDDEGMRDTLAAILRHDFRVLRADTGEAAVAIKQRTDVCAVPAGGVVGEAVVAYTLADAALEKFGGDALPETTRNMAAYLETLP